MQPKVKEFAERYGIVEEYEKLPEEQRTLNTVKRIYHQKHIEENKYFGVLEKAHTRYRSRQLEKWSKMAEDHGVIDAWNAIDDGDKCLMTLRELIRNGGSCKKIVNVEQPEKERQYRSFIMAREYAATHGIMDMLQSLPPQLRTYRNITKAHKYSSCK
jgi:hypothetical protein